MRRRIIILILYLIPFTSTAQDLSTLRSRDLYIDADTILLDTLPVLPGSVFLFDQARNRVPDSLFLILASQARLVPRTELMNSRVKIRYRVFDAAILTPHYHKFPGQLMPKPQGREADPFRVSAEDLPAGSYYSYAELNKRGSLSRGITFGNSQDVVVNSNLNLQLSGRLSDNLGVIAVLSDNNIPIQPEGYSQQISEFDKVYLEVFNEQLSLTGGDFELEGSPGLFMDFYKRAKGVRFRGKFSPPKTPDKNFSTILSGAVSKGKFSRNSFKGIEGNQGPYRLYGAGSEQYIVVLAGSERVYLDGRLLSRGLDRDYVMDYNSAEITFTPRQPITKDKRIIVEFEYSEQSYARFLVFSGNRFETGRGSWFLNVFSEQDDKNQTLRQELTKEEKKFLSGLGNDIENALVPGADSVGYHPDEVLYRKTDSLVAGTLHQGVYVHSNDPDLAVFRLRFSYVGEGQGNYEASKSAINGKVYRWVAPVNNEKQGSYEPVQRLVTPKKKQVISTGGQQSLQNTNLFFEAALSNNDPNTFSSLDKNKNLGYALNFNLRQDFLPADTSRIRLGARAGYRHVSRNFDAVERFRSVEFERDWNLLSEMTGEQEHLAGAGLYFFERNTGFLNLNSEYLNRGNRIEGFRHNMAGEFRYAGFSLEMDGSLLNSNDPMTGSRFLRHRMKFSKHFRDAVLGVREEVENNRWISRSTDSLQQNSFAFREWEVFLTQPDSLQNRGFISYRNRKDFLPKDNHLEYSSRGQGLSLGAVFEKNPRHRLQSTLTFRELSIADTSLGEDKPERNLTGRLEHGLQLAKGAVTTTTFYEVGSGLETSREYSYLEVAPGQGIYSWVDYNGNEQKELDEFEVAQFRDEARFIRIFLPSGTYRTVYINQFNQTINLSPDRIWKSRNGIYGMASMFSNQFAYRINRKSGSGEILKNLNPFQADPDDPEILTLASSIRNNLSFNITGTVFGADYIYQRNLNRSLLSNGFDTRKLVSHGVRGRLSLSDKMTLINQFDRGNKVFASEFLSTRDYDIIYLVNQFSLQAQLSMAFRLITEYGFKSQMNRLDVQQGEEHRLGTELRYSILNKGIITCRLDYIHLDYNDEPGSPVGYEMLQGLQPGNNGTWNILFRRSLSGGIEINLEYSGRVSESQSVVHSGGLQVRANF